MKPYLLAALVCWSLPLCAEAATHWYVDGKNGNDGNAGTSPGAAFKNPWRGLQKAGEGDTVHILPTIVYSPANGFDNTPVNINHGGTPGAWLTVMGGDGSKATRPTIRGADNFAVQLHTAANYVLVTNLDVQTDNKNDKNSWYGMFASDVHHVTFRNNSVHDSGGGGIGTNNSDYIIIDSNQIYNNAFNTRTYCGSGISLYHMTDIDANYTLKNQVKSNIVTMNANADTVGSTCNHLDGNGIIIDDGRHLQSDNKPYKSVTFVYNNVLVGNGGRGIEIFQSDNVLVYHNSTFRNFRDSKNSCYSCGEINVSSSGNIKVFNNIAVSDGAYRGPDFGTNSAFKAQSSSGVMVGNNIMWNDTRNQSTLIFTRDNTGSISIAPFSGAGGNIYSDPLYTLPVLNALTGNFRPLSGSKAYLSGYPKYSVAVDIRNVTRSTTKPTIGAYEQ